MIAPKIIFEDEFFLVIDKPAGLTVNRAETTKGQETLQDWIDSRHSGEPKATPESILDAARMTQEEFISRSGIVHRLDKDTSGLLIIAKNPEAFENLKNQFKNREVVKKYLALVHGVVEPEQGTINAPIARSPFNRMHFGVFPGGREATTEYKVIDSGLRRNDNVFSLLELTPHTGRTHQIRVHMKYLNHPLVSDPIYGGRKNIQSDLKFCPRLFLHATYLKIKHPQSGQWLEFNSPLPADLEKVLELI